MSDHYDTLVEELLSLVSPGFGGRRRPDLVARVTRLTREIEEAGRQIDYICEKAANVREWVGMACSSKGPAPWTLRQAEEHAYSDAYRLKGARPQPVPPA